MTVLSPKNRWEFADMIRFSVDFGAPIALRYPRGSAYEGFEEFRAPIEYGKSETIYNEKDIAIISVGHMFEEAVKTSIKNLKRNARCTI